MSLSIYNTLSGKKEPFIPIEKDKVGMYVCGPTVYDASHIGHARSVVVFDMIYRWLEQSGYQVTYVRNFTDVDDKIIKKSNETGMSCSDITEKYIAEFYAEMDALYVRRPTHAPCATEHIRHIIDFIQGLINAGKAYHVPGGDVYFSIDSFPEYGQLSGRNPDDMRAGSRIAVDEKKKNPLDFTLWKLAKPQEPSWKSPWGEGRPGWHIECSAMSGEYLGKHFDIHGGGKDLIFPHHENEIAQSQALFGGTFAKYWIHNGFVAINHEKMSKSLNNFTMIKDVLAQYSPEVMRMFLLSKHYRSPIDYSPQAMAEVSQGLDRIYTFLGRMEAKGISGTSSQTGALWEGFTQAMDDDFNSARALGLIFEHVTVGNRLLDEMEQETAKIQESISQLESTYSDMKKISHILGFLLQNPEQWFASKKDKSMAKSQVDEAQIDQLIQERNLARKNKDFSRADEIRDELANMGIVLEDSASGTLWHFEK